MRWGWVVLAMGAAYLWKGRDLRALLTLKGEGWERLHPELQRRALLVLEDAARAGLTVGIFEGYRNRATQDAYIKEGTSWVTDADSSFHRWGLAVDFVFLTRAGGWTWLPTADKTPDPRWYTLGGIVEKHGMEWGGRFSRFDGPHAQLRLFTVAALKATYGTPEAVKWA